MPFQRSIVIQFSITPVALGASITVQEQAFTIPASALSEYYEAAGSFGTTPGSYGFQFAVNDSVVVTPPSGYAAGTTPLVGARISTGGAAGTAQVTLIWANLTAAATVPPAGTYTFHLQRV